MNGKSKWDLVVKFFNSKEIGVKITRKEFLAELKEVNKSQTFTTLDSYRLCLMNCGFIKRYQNKSGIYVLVDKIPEDFTLSQAQEFNSWTRNLFIKIPKQC